MNSSTLDDVECSIWGLVSKRFADAGFIVSRREHAEHEWLQVLEQMDYVPVWYTGCMLRYQHSYHQPRSKFYIPLDLVVFHQGAEIAIWPWAAFFDDGNAYVSSHHAANRAVLPPRFVAQASHKSQKKICKLAVEVVDSISMHMKNPCWASSYSQADFKLPEWHRVMMERGAKVRVNHELWVDIDRSLEEIHAGYRKSFKSLINAGMRHWNIIIDETGDLERFMEFRRLHATVAGRITRGSETWQRQFEAIQEQEAVAVYTYSEEGALIGAGLIYLSRDEAFYGVGAFDRTMFDQPLAHIVIHTAIRYAKERGCSRFFIGDRAYAGDSENPEKKSLSLSYFKEGFASSMSPRFTLSVQNNV